MWLAPPLPTIFQLPYFHCIVDVIFPKPSGVSSVSSLGRYSPQYVFWSPICVHSLCASQSCQLSQSCLQYLSIFMLLLEPLFSALSILEPFFALSILDHLQLLLKKSISVVINFFLWILHKSHTSAPLIITL